MKVWRDPLLAAYVALGVVLVPVIVLLAEAYPGYAERMRRAAGVSQLTPIPSVGDLQRMVAATVPDAAACQWRSAYAPDAEPRSGIARVYDLVQGSAAPYRVLVLRHDIACSVCQDVMVAVVYDSERRQWAGGIAISPFERKGEPVDARPFLRQFVGRGVGESHELGVDIDGITGATKSVKGFLNRLDEAGKWVEDHPVGDSVALETGR